MSFQDVLLNYPFLDFHENYGSHKLKKFALKEPTQNDLCIIEI